MLIIDPFQLFHIQQIQKRLPFENLKFKLKNKIQEKVCHITHTSGLLTTMQSVIYTVRGGIFY